MIYWLHQFSLHTSYLKTNHQSSKHISSNWDVYCSCSFLWMMFWLFCMQIINYKSGMFPLSQSIQILPKLGIDWETEAQFKDCFFNYSTFDYGLVQQQKSSIEAKRICICYLTFQYKFNLERLYEYHVNLIIFVCNFTHKLHKLNIRFTAGNGAHFF